MLEGISNSAKLEHEKEDAPPGGPNVSNERQKRRGRARPVAGCDEESMFLVVGV